MSGRENKALQEMAEQQLESFLSAMPVHTLSDQLMQLDMSRISALAGRTSAANGIDVENNDDSQNDQWDSLMREDPMDEEAALLMSRMAAEPDVGIDTVIEGAEGAHDDIGGNSTPEPSAHMIVQAETDEQTLNHFEN